MMLRKTLKHIYHLSYTATGAPQRKMERMKREGKVAIMNLHRVSIERSDYWPPLTPSLFEDFLRFVAANFEVVRIDHLEKARSNKPLAVLSFDDGYYDFIEYALPLIEKYRLPVNMNVIPQCAISGQPIWNVRLYDFLQSSSRDEVNRLAVPGFDRKLASDDASAKVRYGVALSHYLKNRPRAERIEILKSIEDRLNRDHGKTTRMMTTADIRELAGRVQIGAHSYSHESMAFESDDFFGSDVEHCREYFENYLQIPLSIYAFPNGSYRPEQIAVLRSKGVEKILLVDERLADAGEDVLTRLTIYGESLAELKMRSLGS
jgi:peptidoglycan/xylan/chitin deacetylase (PgdA/CDA1 family)